MAVVEPAAPSIALVFGAVSPPQADVVDLMVHLGCSKEVSSYEVTLQNWDAKYSPSGTYPITVGIDGSISLGRTPNCPLLLTLRVENVKYQSTPKENYVIISGRCWGERLFRRVVTATYTGLTGEAIVKDLMDYYAGLSHTRGAVELVEDTDTTYSELEYDGSPVWDILKYIAESADDSGVIGFDFRVAPDGKFEFFPKLSKTNATVIVENIDDNAEYEKDIHRVRNSIYVYGLADKSYPTDKVSLTRSLTPADGTWAASVGVISLDATGAPDGGACVKNTATSNYASVANITFASGYELNCELYPILDVQLKLEDTFSGTGFILLLDDGGKYASKTISASPDETWHLIEAGVGSAYANQWERVDSGFNWEAITMIRVSCAFPGVGSGSIWIHGLYVGGRRYAGTAEDAASQAAYGLREYTEVDEELWSDAECTRRAASLLAQLKDPAEHLHLVSNLLDYGTSPILAADKVHVHLPNENVDADFRVESAEYHVFKERVMELEITLELGRENPKLADFLYGLRCHSPNVEKLSRTKIGKRGAPVATTRSTQGGSHFTTNVEVEKTAPVLNLITAAALKLALGYDGANSFLSSYDGNLVLYSATHIIAPVGDGIEALGDTASAWRYKSLHLKEELWVAGVNTVDTNGRVTMAGLPRDTAGLILEAQGAGFYPMYVDPNGRYTPATHTHTSLVRGTNYVELDATDAVANFFAGDPAVLMGAVGHDGANMFLVSYDGSLVLYAANSLILPNSDGGQNLGDTSTLKRFGSLHLKDSIWVAGVNTVDTSGRVSLSGLPRDTAGLIIEAQGAGFNPMYVDPDGRYTPAAHTHTSLDRSTKHVEIDSTYAVANFLNDASLDGAVGHDGANMFLVAYAGSLVLHAATAKILPNTDGGQDLGDTTGAKRFGALHLKNTLYVAGVQVIDTNGRLLLPAMTRGTSGYVLEAQGAAADPMYVDPDGRYSPAAHDHTSLVRGTNYVEIDATDAVANFYASASLKGAIGHDGSNYFIVAYDGSIVFSADTGLISPASDGGADLGTTSSSLRFGALHLKNALYVAGVQVIDTNGRLLLPAMTRGTSGYVLEAQGAAADPMYVDPDGRYTPAAHESGHANLYPSAGANTGQVGNTTTYWNVMATNSLWNKAQSGFACERALSDTPVERKIQTREAAEEVLTHETTKSWRHMPYDLKDKTGKNIICTCGKSVKEPCPEHREEWEDTYLVNLGAQYEAAAYLVLELSADVRRLEAELAGFKELMVQVLNSKRADLPAEVPRAA